MSGSGFESLVAKLRAKDPAGARNAARALAALKDRRAVAPLIHLLGETSAPTVRNAVAVALRDLGDPSAAETIVACLRDPKTAGSRGTLAWALGAFDCAPFLELLVELVINDNYETARESAEAIVSIESDIDSDVWQRCIAKLKQAIPTATTERADVLRSLLARFETE